MSDLAARITHRQVLGGLSAIQKLRHTNTRSVTVTHGLLMKLWATGQSAHRAAHIDLRELHYSENAVRRDVAVT